MPTLDELFQRRALECPDAIALTYSYDPSYSDSQAHGGEMTLSMAYRELDQASDTLAALLRTCGVCTDVLVGVRMDRGISVIVALIAILKAGGAYVPIDPTHPRDRQEYILGCIEAPVLLTDSANAGVTHTHRCAHIQLDHMGRVLNCDGVRSQGRAPVGPTCPKDETSLAYILFTSGSTGKPKGVAIQHNSVINIVQWFASDLGLTRSDVVLGLTTLTFDISVLEVFMPLLHGAQLHMAPAYMQKDARALVDTLNTKGITVFQATPATFELLMAVGWQGDRHMHVLCGGEAFRMNLAPLTTACKSFRNVYGPTETTIWSTSYRVTTPPTPTHTLPLGTPISHTQLHILDGNLHPCPPGTQGQLYIGGIGLARGYHKRPDLTAQAFIPTPAHLQPTTTSPRIYATGDTVVRDPSDGSLRYVGRGDGQVKIHGYRIELSEIEHALQVHPGLQTAVVLARDDVVPHDKTLVAYVKPHTHAQPPTEQELLSHVRNQLPPYMVPSFVVSLDEFPYTPNGKIDRKQLPKPTTGAASRPPVGAGGKVYADGKDRLVGVVTRVISEAAGMDVDPSFALQGLRVNSIGTVVVVEQLSQALGGIRIRPLEFFQHDTVSHLAHHLHTRLAAERPEQLKRLGVCDKGEKEVSGSTSSPSTGALRPAHIAASSQQLLAGLRGLLIVWVVMEHTYSIKTVLPHRFRTNSVFIAMIQGMSLYLWYAGTQGRVRWSAYFFNKALGVFPVYYCALAMSLPRYIALRVRVSQIQNPQQRFLMFQYTWRYYVVDFLLHATAMQNYIERIRLRAFDYIYYASVQWNHYIYFWLLIGSLGVVFLQLNTETKAWLKARQGRLYLCLLVILGCMVPYLLDVAGWEDRCYQYLPQFLSGVVLAALFLHMHEKRRQRRTQGFWREGRPLLLLAVFAQLAVNTSWTVGEGVDSFLSIFVLPVLGMVILLSLLCESEGQHSWLRSKVLESDVLCKIGDLSFTIYLIHWEVYTHYLRVAIEGWPQIYPPPATTTADQLRDAPLRGAWIRKQSFLLRLLGFMMIVALSWFVQDVFIERIVTPMCVRAYKHTCVWYARLAPMVQRRLGLSAEAYCRKKKVEDDDVSSVLLGGTQKQEEAPTGSGKLCV